MEKSHECPYCKKPCGSEPGKLPQSGETYLPTTKWSCHTCGYKRWDAFTPDPTGKSWKAEE